VFADPCALFLPADRRAMLSIASSTACRALMAAPMMGSAAGGLLPAAAPALCTAMAKLAGHSALFSSSAVSGSADHRARAG